MITTRAPDGANKEHSSRLRWFKAIKHTHNRSHTEFKVLSYEQLKQRDLALQYEKVNFRWKILEKVQFTMFSKILISVGCSNVRIKPTVFLYQFLWALKRAFSCIYIEAEAAILSNTACIPFKVFHCVFVCVDAIWKAIKKWKISPE